MNKYLKRTSMVFIVAIGMAQAIRPNLANPPIDLTRTIQAQGGAANDLAAILNRSCGDCHSNATVWPWYSKVAPTSWLMAYGVRTGRRAVNFSEWAGYLPERQRLLLTQSCNAASAGKMPGPYALLRPETKLSPADVETICAASRSIVASHAR